MNKPIYRTRTINILVNTTQGSVNFPDQPDLRNAYIGALEIFTENDITGPPAASGTVMPIADMKKCNFTLYEGDLAICTNDPILSFHRLQNASTDPFTKDLTVFDNMIMSFTKCTVNVNPGQTLSAATGVVPLRIYFLRPEDLERYAQRNAAVYLVGEKAIQEGQQGDRYKSWLISKSEGN